MDPLRVKSCPKCGGAGIVERRGGTSVFCPMCGASFVGTTAYAVDWNDAQKQFDVSLVFPRPWGNLSNDEILQELPKLIAENSFCRCGAPLVVGNYSFDISGDQVRFVGTFRCNNCSDNSKTFVEKMRDSVAALWKQLTRLKVGPTGIEIEKK